jgi:hypothetical protein
MSSSIIRIPLLPNYLSTKSGEGLPDDDVQGEYVLLLISLTDRETARSPF